MFWEKRLKVDCRSVTYKFWTKNGINPKLNYPDFLPPIWDYVTILVEIIMFQEVPARLQSFSNLLDLLNSAIILKNTILLFLECLVKAVSCFSLLSIRELSSLKNWKTCKKKHHWTVYSFLCLVGFLYLYLTLSKNFSWLLSERFLGRRQTSTTLLRHLLYLPVCEIIQGKFLGTDYTRYNRV